MQIRLVCAAAAAAIAAATAQTAAAGTPQTAICGQIKNGPKATYVFQLNNKTLSGTTWTVFATGVPCAKAMSAAPAILKWWGKAKIDASNFFGGGIACTKERDQSGRAGTAGCTAPGPANSNLELMMTGSY